MELGFEMKLLMIIIIFKKEKKNMERNLSFSGNKDGENGGIRLVRVLEAEEQVDRKIHPRS